VGQILPENDHWRDGRYGRFFATNLNWLKLTLFMTKNTFSSK
jgi:hypothetical protein